MAIAKIVLKKTRTEAVIKIVGTGTIAVTLAELALSDETLATPLVNIHQARWTGGVADTAVVTRNAIDVLRLTACGDWEFNGYTVGEQNDKDFSVTLSANTTLILSLRKVGGYVAPGRATYLTGGA